MLINSSRLDQFQKCNRLYFWNNVFDLGGNSPGIRPAYFNEDQKLGEIVHIGLAAMYRVQGLGLYKKDEQLVKLYKDEALKALDFDALDWEKRNHWLDRLEWVDRLLKEYEKWASANDDFTVVDVEHAGFVQLGEICWSCGHPYTAGALICPQCQAEVHYLAFTTDLLVDQEDRLKVIDHKTAKSASRPYLAMWHYSLQLWGYTYGRDKSSLVRDQNRRVLGYAVNILRKLETVGLPEQTTKQCSECRNGAKKKLTCTFCAGEGRVEKENNPSEQPFIREWESFNHAKAELLVRNRLRTIQDIKREEERFEAEPDAAFPMCTTQCFTYGVCPMLRLCWDWGMQNPAQWYNPPIELMNDFDPQPDDYLSKQRLILEEKR